MSENRIPSKRTQLVHHHVPFLTGNLWVWTHIKHCISRMFAVIIFMVTATTADLFALTSARQMRFKAGNFKYIKTRLIKSSLDILERIYLIYPDIATVSYPKRISCHLRFRFRFCRTFAFCQSQRSLFLSTAQCWGCQCRCTTNPKAKSGSHTEAVLPILGRRIGGKTRWETSGNTINFFSQIWRICC